MSDSSSPSLDLPAALRRRLERLAERRLAGRGAGRAEMHPAGRAGAFREGRVSFLDHRVYVPGDDIRDLDWHAYARTGQPHIKVHGADRARRLRIVLDLSASMAVGGKDRAARLIALATAYAALAGGDAVRLDRIPVKGGPRLAENASSSSFPETSRPLSGAGRERRTASMPPGGIESAFLRGRRAWNALRDALSRLPCEGRSDWNAWAVGVRASTERSGAGERWLVLTDACDETMGEALARTVDAGRSVSLFCIDDAEAARAPQDAPVELTDAETGEVLTLWLDQGRLAAQRRMLEKARERLAAWASRRGWRFGQCSAAGEKGPGAAALFDAAAAAGW